MKSKLFLLVLTVLLLLLSACGTQELNPDRFNGTVLTEPVDVPDFSLVNTAGETVRLSDYEGQIVLLYFGYTFCPDICPTTLAELTQVQSELDDSGELIQTLMVTVDPERDTPQKLGEYIRHFHPDFDALSGTKEQIDAAGAPFGLFYEITEGSDAAGYLVDHSTRVYVVDAEGNYQLSFSYGTPVEDIAADLKLLMRAI